MKNEYLTKKEMDSVRYLFNLVKDTIEYFAEVKVEANLTDRELKEFKIKFLRVLSQSVGINDVNIIINHYDELIEQNKQLQSALITANKILDEITGDIEECCEECLCRLTECRTNKPHPNFQDIRAKIIKAQEEE